MYTIHLHQLKFHAPVGMYEEERVLGNLIELTMDVQFPEPKQYESIEDTLNYELLFRIIEKRIKQPTSLLEALAADIIQAVHHSFPKAIAVQISITKKNPPILGCHGNVGVTLKQQF